MKSKILLLLAVLIAAPATARDLAYMPNQAGGEIVLTDNPKSCDKTGGRLAYSRSPDGSIITGCWSAEENYLMIIWTVTGSVKLFKYEQFTAFEIVAPNKSDIPVAYK